MARLKFGIIVAFIFSIGVLSSCSGADSSNANTGTNASNQPAYDSKKGNDSAEELGSLVQIPFEPEEVTWRAIEADGKKRLIAVILLTEADHKAFTAKHGQPGTDVRVNVEPWFPVELVTMGETSGENIISGKASPASEFYQQPYTAGSLIFIPDTNYLILDLQSG
jgi:hypothetical protein